MHIEIINIGIHSAASLVTERFMVLRLEHTVQIQHCSANDIKYRTWSYSLARACTFLCLTIYVVIKHYNNKKLAAVHVLQLITRKLSLYHQLFRQLHTFLLVN